MKRPLHILTVAAIAVVGCLLWPCCAFASLVETENGWVEDPSVDTSWFNYLEPKNEYAISTEAQLRGLASLVNNEQYLWKPNRVESFEGVTFILTRDITLTDSWTPIGLNEQITFSGNFNGKGHTITGLDVVSEDPYSGFFGHLSGAVRNLNIEGKVNSTADDTGGLVGFLAKDGKVRNCECNVQVNGVNEVGGIVGESYGRIAESVSRGEVVGASMVGGIVGESRGGMVRKSGNRGLIYSNGAGSFNNGTGGVAGRSVSASTIKKCYNVGDVISSNEATGGVVGFTNSSGSSILDSYNIGSIRIEDAQVESTGSIDPGTMLQSGGMKMIGSDLPVYAGGIAGYVGSQAVEISNCYNAGKITGADYTGGIIGKCQNEMFSADPAAFHNNYYGKGSFDSAIAADRDNRPMKVRGAATEIYDSAFGNLSSSLGDAYMDDRSGEYGSQGYPVLTWQKPVQTEDALAVMKNIDPTIQQWLHDANLMMGTAGFPPGQILLEFFNPDSITVTPPETDQLLQNTPEEEQAPAGTIVTEKYTKQTTPTKGPNN